MEYCVNKLISKDILLSSNKQETTMSKRTIYSRFKEMVENFPENPAIIEDSRTITYSELDKMVNSILAKFYNQKEKFVGIVMHHGARGGRECA